MEWFALKPSVLAGIMEHFASGLPVMETTQNTDADANKEDSDDDEVVQQIKHLLDTRVRPAVAMDGGDITFHSFHEGSGNLADARRLSGMPPALPRP